MNLLSQEEEEMRTTIRQVRNACFVIKRMIGYFLATAMVFGALLTDAESALRCTSGFRFCDNCDTQVTFYTKKNTACRQNYHIAKGIGGIFSQRVTKKPRGVYGTVNQTTAAYEPPRNYVGNDYFEVVVSYDRGGTKYTTNLKVTVNITE